MPERPATATSERLTMVPRQTADERREAIIAAAIEEFAVGGLAGASTEAIARRAGISQPYVFRLFRTKKHLFLEVVRHAFVRTTEVFTDAARRYRAGEIEDCESALGAMGRAYMELLEDRTLLLVQLQAYAAAGDPEVREAVRSAYVELQAIVSHVSGARPDEVHAFFAEGMLLNVSAALGLDSQAGHPA